MLILTEKNWKLLNDVNQTWNDKITYTTDSEHYHVSELWRFPKDLKGDCEDYAVAKRQRLMSHGIQGYFATCWCYPHKKGYHAVLIVPTDHGDMVLDNRFDFVYNVDESTYDWHKIECENHIWRLVK